MDDPRILSIDLDVYSVVLGDLVALLFRYCHRFLYYKDSFLLLHWDQYRYLHDTQLQASCSVLLRNRHNLTNNNELYLRCGFLGHDFVCDDAYVRPLYR